MTREEFVALKDHARIKYTGSRPLDQLFAIRHRTSRGGWGGSGATTIKCKAMGGYNSCDDYCVTPTMPKTFVKKGIVVSTISEDTWSTGPEKGTISLYYYGGSLSPVDPAEWTLVDARKWVEGETEYKRAKSFIPLAARRFKEETKLFLKRYKSTIEYKLDSLPLDKKLKLIMELSPEDKKWFTILNAEPDDVIAMLENAYNDDTI